LIENRYIILPAPLLVLFTLLCDSKGRFWHLTALYSPIIHPGCSCDEKLLLCSMILTVPFQYVCLTPDLWYIGSLERHTSKTLVTNSVVSILSIPLEGKDFIFVTLMRGALGKV